MKICLEVGNILSVMNAQRVEQLVVQPSDFLLEFKLYLYKLCIKSILSNQSVLHPNFEERIEILFIPRNESTFALVDENFEYEKNHIKLLVERYHIKYVFHRSVDFPQLKFRSTINFLVNNIANIGGRQTFNRTI